MSSGRRDEDHIGDIVSALRDACAFVEGLSQQDFMADPKTQFAVQHRLMIAGEAVKRLSVAFRERHPAVRWTEMAGLRDVLIHSYHRVSVDDVWMMVRDDVPAVLGYIEQVPADEG